MACACGAGSRGILQGGSVRLSVLAGVRAWCGPQPRPDFLRKKSHSLSPLSARRGLRLAPQWLPEKGLLNTRDHAALQKCPPAGPRVLTSGTSAQKSFDQDDGQGARRGLPVILDGLPCTSRDRDREVAASARCGSSGQQGCGFSLRTPSCPVLSIRTPSHSPDRPSPA